MVGVGPLFDLTVTLSDCESCLELPTEGVKEAVPLRDDRGIPERTPASVWCGGSHCWQGQLISELTQLPEQPRPDWWLGVAEERHFGAGHDAEAAKGHPSLYEVANIDRDLCTIVAVDLRIGGHCDGLRRRPDCTKDRTTW